MKSMDICEIKKNYTEWLQMIKTRVALDVKTKL